jgi:hypothetical protein
MPVFFFLPVKNLLQKECRAGTRKNIRPPKLLYAEKSSELKLVENEPKCGLSLAGPSFVGGIGPSSKTFVHPTGHSHFFGRRLFAEGSGVGGRGSLLRTRGNI